MVWLRLDQCPRSTMARAARPRHASWHPCHRQPHRAWRSRPHRGSVLRCGAAPSPARAAWSASWLVASAACPRVLPVTGLSTCTFRPVTASCHVQPQNRPLYCGRTRPGIVVASALMANSRPDWITRFSLFSNIKGLLRPIYRQPACWKLWSSIACYCWITDAAMSALLRCVVVALPPRVDRRTRRAAATGSRAVRNLISQHVQTLQHSRVSPGFTGRPVLVRQAGQAIAGMAAAGAPASHSAARPVTRSNSGPGDGSVSPRHATCWSGRISTKRAA